MANDLNSKDLLDALGAAYTHKVSHAPVRDLNTPQRAAYMDAMLFATQFIQGYAATWAELEGMALEAEADTLTSPDPYLED